MQSPFLWSTLMIVIHLKLAQQERSCYLRITPAITGTYHVILPPVYRSTSSLARTTCMHARIYACRYTHIYICVYTYVRISVCVLLCVCIYIYTHRYVNIYICECVCVCVDINAYVPTYNHRHLQSIIHTHRLTHM